MNATDDVWILSVPARTPEEAGMRLARRQIEDAAGFEQVRLPKQIDLADPFDAVFSNAALHWIPDEDQDALIESVRDALRPGGRFVAECGGHGNVAAVVDATRAELEARGHDTEHPWYFPTVGEYASRLEAHGFEVRYATLFDRPTELDDGEDGLAAWLSMFGDGLLAPLAPDEREDVVAAVEDRLRDDLFRDGSWYADYRRLRFVAVRE